jgi:DNA polymerase III gamma/tau subunit
MAQPGYPAQVRSGLLGQYQPRQPGTASTEFGAGRGARTGVSASQFSAPDLNQLTQKYAAGAPQVDIQTDPTKLYEGMAGGFRADTEGLLTTAGQQAISQAATAGREVSDVVARYLPEAVRAYAGAAGDVAAAAGKMGSQAEVAKTQAEQVRHESAQAMARFDAAQAQQQHQFVQRLETEYQMHKETLDNNLKIAMSRATTDKEIAQAQNAHNMAMNQMNQQMQQRTMQYQEQQKNARQSQQLKLYDQYYGGQAQNRQQQLEFDMMKYGQSQQAPYTPTVGSRATSATNEPVTAVPTLRRPSGYSSPTGIPMYSI